MVVFTKAADNIEQEYNANSPWNCGPTMLSISSLSLPHGYHQLFFHRSPNIITYYGIA
ncbi:MAG: hypothetical protein J6W04_02970 [Bacteroidales bacterium]|nr:hypothetical protein [Bacteroidales bacterium]